MYDLTYAGVYARQVKMFAEDVAACATQLSELYMAYKLVWGSNESSRRLIKQKSNFKDAQRRHNEKLKNTCTIYPAKERNKARNDVRFYNRDCIGR